MNIYGFSAQRNRNTSKGRTLKDGGIIAGGVAHAENNNIGDKGIPVVSIESYNTNNGKYIKSDKQVEVESEEIVFNEETSLKINKLVEEYNTCKCEGKLRLLGQVILEATRNLVDETCRTSCKFESKLQKIK